MPVIRFDDGSQQVYKNAVFLTDIIKDKKITKKKSLIAILVNNKFANFNSLIKEDANILFYYEKDKNALNFIRYTCAQLLGYAVKTIWPCAQIGNHDITSNGFYCDVDMPTRILEKDLVLLEKSMNNIISTSYDIFNKKVSFNEALRIFNECTETYKTFLIKKNQNDINLVSLYYHQKYVDIDIGIQVINIKFCKYFKLQKISGAYWENNPKNKMLQRIYGTAWSDKEQLEKYLSYIIDLEKRDHRKIGKFLNLYHIEEESPGMVFWHNHGWIIFHELELFVRKKLQKYKYKEVKTPVLLDKLIWKKSGHWEHYKDSIFTTRSENKEYCIKPMNCPGHVQIFNIGIKSYRDLPIRMAEFGSCHRHEFSGSLHGLMRIRHFTQDDAHIFCTDEQVRSEIDNCIKMIYDLYSIFNFKRILVKLSTRPKKRIGSDDLWDQAEQDLSDMLIKNNILFEYQAGEGAFYGPKIEFILQDSLDRNWQCGTIQLDFYLSTRLNAFYIDQNNNRKIPVIIHRAILGSMERFIGILIEENIGHLPTWLSPIQVIIISVSHIHTQYIQNIEKKFSAVNIRVEVDLRNEKIGFKIREHILRRIPYIIICGKKEIDNETISVRTRAGLHFQGVDIHSFIKKLKKEIDTYSFCQLEE